jgi:hypothetical protein
VRSDCDVCRSRSAAVADGRPNVGPTKWAVCDRRALRARVSHTSRRRWPPPGVRLIRNVRRAVDAPCVPTYETYVAPPVATAGRAAPATERGAHKVGRV